MIEEAPKWRSEEHRQMKWSVERSDYFCFTEVLFFKVPLKAWETCVTLHREDGGAEGWFDKRWKKGSDTPATIFFSFFLFFPRPLLKSPILQVAPIIFSMRQCDIYGQVPTAKANIMSFHSAIHIVLPPGCLRWGTNKVPDAVEWHWQSWLSKHSFSRLESRLGCREGRDGKKGGCHFRLGNFWCARQGLDKGNVAGLYIRARLTGSAALGTGSNAVPESAAHLLALCTCLVPHKDAPCRPGSTPPIPLQKWL